jgi:hypothetical protein
LTAAGQCPRGAGLRDSGERDAFVALFVEGAGSFRGPWGEGVLVSGHHDDGSPAAMPEEPQHPSRRSVLRGAAGASVAGIAATALVGTAGPALAKAARPAEPAVRAEAADHDSTEPVVVHLRDVRSGELDVFRGTSQVRLHDPELAARLLRASR